MTIIGMNMPGNTRSRPFVPSWRLTRAAMTSGLIRRRYRVIRIEVPTTTTKNSQPLAHAQFPAGRNRHRRKMSNVHPTPRNRRRRSVGSGLLLVMSSRSSQDRSLPMPMDRTRRSLRLSPDSPGLVQFNRNVNWLYHPSPRIASAGFLSLQIKRCDLDSRDCPSRMLQPADPFHGPPIEIGSPDSRTPAVATKAIRPATVMPRPTRQTPPQPARPQPHAPPQEPSAPPTK